jgi:hypothetical protein
MQIELGDEIQEHSCECCGRTIRSGQGSVVDDGGDLTARYWFDMASHPRGERGTRLLVVLYGVRRGRSSRPSVSFVVHGRVTPGGLAFSLRDPADSPVVPRRRVTGRTLARRRALHHARLPVLWEIVDAVVERDPALAGFLNEPSEPG